MNPFDEFDVAPAGSPASVTQGPNPFDVFDLPTTDYPDQVSRAATRPTPATTPAPNVFDAFDSAVPEVPVAPPDYRSPEENNATPVAVSPADAGGSISATPAGGITDWVRGLINTPRIAAAKIGTGALRVAGDITNTEFLKEAGKNLRSRYEKEETRVDPVIYDDTLKSVYSGFKSAVQTVAALSLPGGPLVALTGLTSADAYGKYRDRGASPMEAAIASSGEGIVEYATEKMPMKFLVDKLGKVGAGEFLKGLMGREVAGEQVATFLQDAIDTAVANPDKTWGQYLNERPGAAADTLIATIASVGAITGVHRGVKAVTTDLSAARDTRAADAAQSDAMTKMATTFDNTPRQPPDGLAGAPPAVPTAPAGPPGSVDPLTLEPIAQAATVAVPEAPLALPPPGQVAIRMAEPLPVTEVPAIDPAQAHADAVYGARAAEDSRQKDLAAHQIEIDPNDQRGSIAAIAAAPVTPLTVTPTVSPADRQAHADSAGDLADSLAQIAQLKRDAKTVPPTQRPAIRARIADMEAQARGLKEFYASQYGAEAAEQMHQTAAETLHLIKGNYKTLVKPDVQVSAALMKREQPEGVNNASPVRGNEGQVSQGGQEGQPGVQRGPVEGGSNLQQPSQEAPGNRSPQEGNRQQRAVDEAREALNNLPGDATQEEQDDAADRLRRATYEQRAAEERPTPPQSSVPELGAIVPISNAHAGAPAPKVVTEVDRAAHEAAASPLNDRSAPTSPQADKGNYLMGHQKFSNGGLDLSVENPSGSVRTDKNQPPKWRSRLVGFHYGYDRSAIGQSADSTTTKKQGPDWFVKEGTHPSWNGPVFVMDAVSQQDGSFDEHKFMAGVHTEAEARAGFAKQYPKAWKLGKISKTTMDGYRTWKLTADPKTPWAPQPHTKGVKSPVVPANTNVGSLQNYRNWIDGVPGAIITPNSFSANVKRKTVGTAVSVLRAHNVQHQVMNDPPQRLMDDHGVKPLNAKEQSVVSGAMADAIEVYGLPAVVFSTAEGMNTFTSGGDAVSYMYPNGESSVGFRYNLLDAVISGHSGWSSAIVPIIIHESWHLIDNRSDGRNRMVSSATLSHHFDIEPVTGRAIGDVIKEAQRSYVVGPVNMRTFFGYPFSKWGESVGDPAQEQTLKEEVAAQLWTVYNIDPSWMQKHLPISYQLFKEVHEKLSTIDRTQTRFQQSQDVRNAVHAILTKGGGEVRNVSDQIGRTAESDRGPLLRLSRESDVEGDRRGVLDALTAQEREKLRNHETATNFIRHFLTMPSSKETAAIAWAGRAKRGWYRQAAASINEIFGQDGPRFTALLGATSPRVRVEDNLKAALKTWVLWDKAGRPQSHAEIAKLLHTGKEGTAVLTGAALKNVIRSLTHPNPAHLVISGPKVDSFFANLMGNVIEVTNDGWMSAWAFVDAKIFGGTLHDKSISLTLTEPGKSAGYMAMSAHIRQSAAILTKKTGELWTPAEVQETVWSWTKTLYEKASKNTSARSIIKDRALTQEMIAATPDFGTLIQGGDYGKILRDAGYGPQLRRVGRLGAPSAAEQADQAQRRDAGEKAPFAAGVQQRLEEASAKRIDALRTQRADTFNESEFESEAKNAIYDDFQESPEAALQRPGWAIVTATRGTPGSIESETANDSLHSYLTKQKIDFEEVGGSYEGEDQGRSFLIFAPRDQAMAIGKRYAQESILTSRGLEYADGKLQAADPSKTVIGDEAKKEPYFSTLPDGTAFSMGMAESTLKSRNSETTAPSEDRSKVVESTKLVGDGRGFTEFFTEASLGKRAPDVKKYVPVLDIPQAMSFSAEYIKHRGNFDDHIATSIPGFREVQQAVGNAIVQTYPEGARLLDVAASEGAFNKAISKLSNGKIETLALDPNLTMAKFFKEHSAVTGAKYEVAAFGSAEDAGKLAWTEGGELDPYWQKQVDKHQRSANTLRETFKSTGEDRWRKQAETNEQTAQSILNAPKLRSQETEILTFAPKVKYDIIHESMGFQFISNTRNAQFARVKEMMTPDGIAIFEEKIKEDTPQWHRNEKQKDAYKARYFTATQIAAKKAEVLEKGVAAVAESDSKAEQAVVGMNDLMTTGHELETALKNNWKYVTQYWDSGNFKGYVASDDSSKVQGFVSKLGDLNSAFSTVDTPTQIGEDVTPTPDDSVQVNVRAIEEETGALVEVNLRAKDVLHSLDTDLEKIRKVLLCLSS